MAVSVSSTEHKKDYFERRFSTQQQRYKIAVNTRDNKSGSILINSGHDCQPTIVTQPPEYSDGGG